MKALIFNGPKDIQYETFKDPELVSPNSVILQVTKCSICGSDLHMYHGDAIGKTNYGEETTKFCTGHEFIGEVVETGSDVHGFKVGDKVLSAGGTGCGRCDYCLVGSVEKCRKLTAFGITPVLNGGQAELVCVPNADQTLLRTDDGLTDEQAILLTDALATAHFGIVRADIKPGADVAIVGLGPIGILGVELAFLFGAARVFAIDPVEGRRALATALGAIALPPGKESELLIREKTQGHGTSSVFEASGATAAINSVLRIVSFNGTASFIGLPQKDATLSMQRLLYKSVTVRGGVAPVQKQWPPLVALLKSGKLKGENIFSHTFKLEDGAKAFDLFDKREDNVVKIMIDVP